MLLHLLILLYSCVALCSAASCTAVYIDARLAEHVTAPYYASFNVDSSSDRSFFLLDWSSPAIVAAAAGLGSSGGSHIRFGGTGNNALYYNVSDYPCTPKGSSHTCLNATTWANVAALSTAARSPIIFGANFFPNGRSPGNNTFDPSNAKAFFQFAHARGDAIWGVELGNELGPDSSMTPAAQAAGLLLLDDVLRGIYGNASRPFLVGPDPLGFHTPAPPPNASGFVPSVDIISYLTSFVESMQVGRDRHVAQLISSTFTLRRGV